MSIVYMYIRPAARYDDEIITWNVQRNIKALRKHISYTQERMADLLQINRSTLASYEEGRAFPKPGVLLFICQTFQVDMISFLTGPIKLKDNEQS